MKIAITGANSSVGQSLVAALLNQPQWQVNAGARSESALATLVRGNNISPRQIDYGEPENLADFFHGVDCVIHLAGILIPTSGSSYQSANVDATAAVVNAAVSKAVKRLIFISVIGAGGDSRNPYYRSKAEAEQRVLKSPLAGSVIRTPILLGPTTAGARSLLNSAAATQARVLGGGKYEIRPLDTDDLVQAILQCCRHGDSGRIYELVGPEPITYRKLIETTAARLNKEVNVKSVPIGLAKFMAAVSGLFRRGGITPTVIEVITRDEVVTHNAADELGVSLTPLDDTLTKIIEAQA